MNVHRRCGKTLEEVLKILGIEQDDEYGYEEVGQILGYYTRNIEKLQLCGYIDQQLSHESLKGFFEVSEDFLKDKEYIRPVEASLFLGVSKQRFFKIVSLRGIACKINPITYKNEYKVSDIRAYAEKRVNITI